MTCGPSDGRMDFNMSAKDQIFGSYSYRHVNRQDPLCTSNPLIGNGNFATQYRWHQQSLALGWTHTISPNLINDARFGFSRDYAHSDPNGLTLGTSQAESAIGLTGIPAGPNDAGIPPIFFFGSLRTMGTGAWRPQFQISQACNFIDNLNWLKGSHSFKFGYQYLRRTDNFFDIEAPQGLLIESGAVTNSFNIALPDLLLGDANIVIFTTPHVVHYFQPGHSFYGMDTWKTDLETHADVRSAVRTFRSTDRQEITRLRTSHRPTAGESSPRRATRAVGLIAP